ncbi:MAG TPA: L,D-transpeptidase [Longimicrobium sp.]|jgi:hypothetical protein|uniref:L,D-transpeptidase n=1 Tax=Longimicrobium sp. TaxID=2029185 RepID=UPI002EDA19D0
MNRISTLLGALALLVAGAVSRASAQQAEAPTRAAGVREAAAHASGRRIVVSVADRRLWWMNGRDTLFAAPIAVGTGDTLRYRGRAWRFETPRGVRRVIRKEANPVWTPPDWHYVELARDSGWSMVRLDPGPGVMLADSTRLVVRGDRVGRVLRDGTFDPVPPDEEVIFGLTLYVPPIGTANRRIAGELGPYKLELGDGYMLHGTPHQDSIGQAATHGCIRLSDEAITHLYRHVPLGTPVYIY